MYRYRIYPSRKQKVRIINSLKTCKTVYNELLAFNIDTYKFGKISLNKFDMNNYLSGRKDCLYAEARQNISDRVHKAFQNFFRRVKDKSCKEKGFPRFKSRVNSITFPQNGFKLLSDKRLELSKIGNVPIILHRVPKGKIKTLTIKQNKANQWFAVFSCEIPESKVIHPSKQAVGIDIGLENFAILSNGISIPNPRYLIKAEHKIKRLHRRVSRKAKGSANRRKARTRLSKLYERVANQRSDFLHKLSRNLTLRYGIIAVEKLNIKDMLHNHHLAKHIGDASWNQFLNMLPYKAVISGGEIREVDAKGTTNECFCGQKVDMPLSSRIFHCPSCNYTEHRDIKSSLLIYDRAGLARIYTPVETPPLQHHSNVASEVVEAGTICGN